MISDIKEAKKCLKYVSEYRQNIVFIHELIMHSNCCVEKMNNTYEANAFNFILSTLHARMILDLKKILEPSKKDKKNNIATLMEFIKRKKDDLAKQHYEYSLRIPTNICGNISSEMRNHLRKCDEEDAQEAFTKCEKTIEKIGSQWDKIWNHFSEKKLYGINSARTVIAHSVDHETAKLPSLNKIKRVLCILRYFIEKLDFVINNSGYHYESEKKQLSDIAKRFWDRIQ